MRYPPHSQSNEGEILARLARHTNAPKTFVEFGFHWNEFNCIGLVREFSGLLVDGGDRNVRLARRLFPKNIRVETRFLTLENLGFIEEHFKGRSLGILSIDVDGNDYWFLQRLLPMRPAIIAVEYNASFLLNRITIPYQSDFDRHKAHPSGLYCGASLVALAELCRKHGYGLVAVSDSGANAFFVANERLTPDLHPLAPESAYRECTLTNLWNGSTAAEQWNTIRHLDFVEV
ncbi:MAG: FkbM family methyltransferase [Proteobacteria bacterium]|nr:FkbM family methyltransferase [Pseudomonadota bacterium]